MIARVIVGVLIFCGIPAAVGVARVGWGGLVFGLTAPAFVLLLGALFAAMVTIEWVFGATPKQQQMRQRPPTKPPPPPGPPPRL